MMRRLHRTRGSLELPLRRLDDRADWVDLSFVVAFLPLIVGTGVVLGTAIAAGVIVLLATRRPAKTTDRKVP